ncbi:MAG: FAD-binding oxidoreductase [Spirochaetes bacterium]|nr:MAG: FAD-binding oxidoreductase [Spirochaetota bacterium]
MTCTYDCAVVGGGIAGLMTALRLAEHGWSVVLIERDRLGSGATSSNHGVIHSGALFSRLHPEIVPFCYAALSMYRDSFPDCIVPTGSTWYVGTAETLSKFQAAWDRLEIPHEDVSRGDLTETLRDASGRRCSAASIPDAVISTRKLIETLSARCAYRGVRVLSPVGAVGVSVSRNGVDGVVLPVGVIGARHVVLCAGIGSHELLQSFESKATYRLKSRLDFMMSFSSTSLDRPIMGLEFGWPTVVPALNGTALASRYGTPQPKITRGSKWSVPSSDISSLVEELSEMFHSEALDPGSGRGWACSKTEYADGLSDRWGVEPNYAVIDHGSVDGIDRLWTMLPGKMTLAMHASHDLVTRIVGRESCPILAPVEGTLPGVSSDLLARNPWKALL